MNKKLLTILFSIVALLTLQISSFAQSPSPQNDFQNELKNPKPASASLYNLGLKSYEQGDISSAITFFKKSIDLDPNFVDAYFNLGAIYKKQKNYFNAIQAFQKAVDLSKEDYESIYELASCYLEDKKYDKAKEFFSLVPTNSPKHTDAQQNIVKADRYIAIDSAAISGNTEKILEPETQAQLLADKLGKSVENTEGFAQVSNNVSEHAIEKTMVPSNETFIPSVKTITSNFNGPAGIAKDSQNNIYIANFVKNRIDKIAPDGKREVFIENFGLNGPIGLAIDRQDNLYVANYTGDSIVKISSNKTISILVDKLAKPYYLFYDSALSKLYATVQGNNSLVEIDISPSNEPITSR